MPFYEYRCESCGHQLEALQKIADAPLVYCPECGEARLKKLVSKSAFRLKGGGWYATDFKHSGARPDKDAPGKSGDGDAGGDSKTDSANGGKSDAGDGGGDKTASKSSAAGALQKSA